MRISLQGLYCSCRPVHSCDAYWLSTPFSFFPFTSPPVRHRVPLHFNWTLPRGCRSLPSVLATPVTNLTSQSVCSNVVSFCCVTRQPRAARILSTTILRSAVLPHHIPRLGVLYESETEKPKNILHGDHVWPSVTWSFIPQSYDRQVNSHFQNDFATECNLVLPLTISSTLSFPKDHPVAADVFFFVFYPSLYLSFINF